MTEIPVEAIDGYDDVTLICPVCEQDILAGDLGVLFEGPVYIAFHEGCGAVLNAGLH